MKKNHSYLVLIICLLHCTAYAQLVATPDPQTIRMNQEILINVLANDKAFNGAPATKANIIFSIVKQPTHGRNPIKIDTELNLCYEPFTGYIGEDIITYRICDVANPAICQQADVKITINPFKSKLVKWIEGNVSIQKSLDDANITGDPAEIAYFSPISGENAQGNKPYFQINGALGLNVIDGGPNFSFGPKISYNRNSGLDEPQNSLAIAVATEYVPNGQILTGTLNHRWDFQKKTESFQFVGLYTPEIRFFGNNYKSNGFFLSGPLPPGTFITDASSPAYKRFQFLYTVSLGSEAEYRYNAAPEKVNEKGWYIRPVAKIGIKVSPPKLHNRLVLSVNYNYRYDVLQPKTYGLTTNHHLFDLGLDYNVLNRAKVKSLVAIGINYKNGDNPIEALPKNEYWSLTLKFKSKGS